MQMIPCFVHKYIFKKKTQIINEIQSLIKVMVSRKS